jgi:hypothetical protein
VKEPFDYAKKAKAKKPSQNRKAARKAQKQARKKAPHHHTHQSA